MHEFVRFRFVTIAQIKSLVKRNSNRQEEAEASPEIEFG